MNIKINLIYAQHRYSNIGLLSYIACKKNNKKCQKFLLLEVPVL